MKIPIVKLKTILLYFCTNTDLRFLGKTKLLKLFYFLDFLHIKKFGIPVTYDEYYHLEHGPIPTVIKNLIDDLANNPESSLLSDTITIEKVDGQNLQKIVNLRDICVDDMDLLSQSELLVLEEVCRRFGLQNTKYTEDVSHKESPWKNTDELQRISYSLAAYDDDCSFPKEELELLDRMCFNA